MKKKPREESITKFNKKFLNFGSGGLIPEFREAQLFPVGNDCVFLLISKN